jgi:LysR family glycine cleavage system transcriptional activator
LHPDIAIELHTSMELEDLQRQGFHAALRQGDGHWRGLQAERLIDSPLIALGSPAAARRLAGRGPDCLAREPLLGDAGKWQRYLALAGCKTRAATVASFNDAGMMLNAVEQDIGIALGRELLAADALAEGRLVRLAAPTLDDKSYGAYWLAYAPELHGWPPMQHLRRWLKAELAASQRKLRQLTAAGEPAATPAERSTAGATGNRSRARSAAPAPAAAPRPRHR